MRKVDDALQAMSRGLAEKAYCGGTHFSLADIATGCALGYLDFRFPTIDWRARHANLARLYDKLAQRASFSDSLPV
jgi:glutathione S-transferase